MARLTEGNRGSLAFNAAPIVERQQTWLDMLPHCCPLPTLFKTGLSLDKCLELLQFTEKQQNKVCRQNGKKNCAACHSAWSKSTEFLLIQKQIDEAASGNSQMLQWCGKAILRQTEPIPESDTVEPAQINILGLNVDQEKEIAELKAEIKKLKERDNEPAD